MANKAVIHIFLCIALLSATCSFGKEIFLPWGKRAGAVNQQLASPSERVKYTGPTSVRVGPNGDLYILDTLGSKIERYSVDGNYVATHVYPSASQYDEELTGIDFAFSPQGAIYVLEEAMHAIMVIDEKGKFKGLRPLPNLTNNPLMLTGIECDEVGRIYVFNGYDSSVFRFSLTDEKAEKCVSDIAMQMVMVSRGAFLGYVEVEADSFSHFDIIKVSPFEKAAKEKLFTLKTEKPLCDISFLGQDKEGRLYVEAAEGAIERPSSRRVYVFKGTKLINKFVVPPKPRRLSSLRTRVLLPNGELYCVRVKGDGFVLQSYP